jgi:hypothetical protein
MTFTRFRLRIRNPSTDSTQPILYHEPRAQAAPADRVLATTTETELTFDTYRTASVSRSRVWRRWSRSGKKLRGNSIASSESESEPDSGRKKGLLASLKPLFSSKKAEQEIGEGDVIEGISLNTEFFNDADEEVIMDDVGDENQEDVEYVGFHAGRSMF